MAGIDDLGKELDKKGPGGIPVWGYGVALAGLVIGVEFFRNRTGTSATGATGTQGAGATGSGTSLPQTSTTTTVSGGGGGSWKPPWYWWTYIRPREGMPVPHPHNNKQWQSQSEDWLLSKGEDPQQVEDAIDDYLHRQPLGPEEKDMVEMVIRAWGEPPDGRPWHIIDRKNKRQNGGGPSPDRHPDRDPDTDKRPGKKPILQQGGDDSDGG